MSQSIKSKKASPVAYNNEAFIFKINTLRNIELRSVILNFLFRYISLVDKINMVRQISEAEYNEITSETHISFSIVSTTIKKFLMDLVWFQEFLKKCKISHNPKNLGNKVRAYLHKIYRFAPIFDYKRARRNLEILHRVLSQLNFWPQITTQLALLIYITDKNDKNKLNNKKILQKNLRALCSCSAYAFHRTRNILKIN
ncbi:MAG: hypothetical protein ACFFAN_19165 [Promethearchaeota archaeon]